jgi:hypothetical protein
MLGKNDTGFAAIGFEQAHRDGHDMGVLAVRGRYTIQEDESLLLDGEQDLVLVDEYEGNPHQSPMVRAADLIPFKPATDITILGKTYAPKGEAATEWLAGIRIGELAHVIRAKGRRQWMWHRDGWRLSSPEAVTEVDLDYRLAASDLSIDGEDDPEVSENPIGLRIPPRRGCDEVHALSLPSIESSEDDYSDPFARRLPQGFSPVPPFWRLRQRFAGTYDDDWSANRHPQLPEDFDYRFYQSAHPDMVYPGYLRGDERAEIARLVPGGGTLRFSLPNVQPVAVYRWRDGREVTVLLNLDGVHIDLRTPPYRVDITWRCWLPVCPNFLRMDLHVEPLEKMLHSEVPRTTIDGLSEVAA